MGTHDFQRDLNTGPRWWAMRVLTVDWVVDEPHWWQTEGPLHLWTLKSSFVLYTRDLCPPPPPLITPLDKSHPYCSSSSLWNPLWECNTQRSRKYTGDISFLLIPFQQSHAQVSDPPISVPKLTFPILTESPQQNPVPGYCEPYSHHHNNYYDFPKVRKIVNEEQSRRWKLTCFECLHS